MARPFDLDDQGGAGQTQRGSGRNWRANGYGACGSRFAR
jgi:hypothetical protein